MSDPVKPTCADGCPNYNPASGMDGACHVFGPPFKYVKADDFCPKHPEWNGYLIELGLGDPDEDGDRDELMLEPA